MVSPIPYYLVEFLYKLKEKYNYHLCAQSELNMIESSLRIVEAGVLEKLTDSPHQTAALEKINEIKRHIALKRKILEALQVLFDTYE